MIVIPVREYGARRRRQELKKFLGERADPAGRNHVSRKRRYGSCRGVVSAGIIERNLLGAIGAARNPGQVIGEVARTLCRGRDAARKTRCQPLPLALVVEEEK